MPIYEYQCLECHKRFEKLQKLSDKPCQKCPSCDGLLRKLISSPAIQFKGNGFYINDYAKKSSPDGESKSKDTSKEISKDTSKDASKDTPKDTSKDTSKDDASGEKPAKDKKAETIPSDKSC